MSSKFEINSQILSEANSLIQEVNRFNRFHNITVELGSITEEVDPAEVAIMKFMSNDFSSSGKSSRFSKSMADKMNRLESKVDKAQKWFELANAEFKLVEKALRKHTREPKVVNLLPNLPIQTKMELKLLEIVLSNSNEAASFIVSMQHGLAFRRHIKLTIFCCIFRVNYSKKFSLSQTTLSFFCVHVSGKF